jgi:hypothetical protein
MKDFARRAKTRDNKRKSKRAKNNRKSRRVEARVQGFQLLITAVNIG